MNCHLKSGLDRWLLASGVVAGFMFTQVVCADEKPSPKELAAIAQIEQKLGVNDYTFYLVALKTTSRIGDEFGKVGPPIYRYDVKLKKGSRDTAKVVYDFMARMKKSKPVGRVPPQKGEWKLLGKYTDEAKAEEAKKKATAFFLKKEQGATRKK